MNNDLRDCGLQDIIEDIIYIMEPHLAPPLYRTVLSMLLRGEFDLAGGVLDAHPEFLEMAVGGESLLHFCVIENAVEAVEFLVKRGASVEQRAEDDDETPLLDSINLPTTEILELLLKHGAKPNVCSCAFGWALEHAVEKCNYDAVLLLLAYGANVTNVRDFQLVVNQHFSEDKRQLIFSALSGEDGFSPQGEN